VLKQAANPNGLPCIQAAGKRFAEGCFSVFGSSVFGIFLHPKAFEFVFCCCSRKGANQHQFVLLKQYKTNYDLIASFNNIKFTKKRSLNHVSKYIRHPQPLYRCCLRCRSGTGARFPSGKRCVTRHAGCLQSGGFQCLHPAGTAAR
jgi:hypothetical protein